MALAQSWVLSNQKLSWSVQSDRRGLSSMSCLSLLVLWLGRFSWVMSPLQSDIGLHEHLTFSVRHVLQWSSNIGICGGIFWSVSLSMNTFGGYPIPWQLLMKVPESHWHIQVGVTYLSSPRVDLVLTFFHAPYFSVLVNWSVWRVNFPHLLSIFNLTSMASFGIWHTKNPWKSKLTQSGCGWSILNNTLRY